MAWADREAGQQEGRTLAWAGREAGRRANGMGRQGGRLLAWAGREATGREAGRWDGQAGRQGGRPMAGRGAGRPGLEHHRRPPACLGFPSEIFLSTTPHPLYHTIEAARAFDASAGRPRALT